jgi:hypothetical protein
MKETKKEEREEEKSYPESEDGEHGERQSQI